MADPKESAIMLDHDEDVIWVDTRSEAIASMARRAGLREVTSRRSGAYTRFVGVLSSVNVRIRRRRVLDDDSKARLRSKLAGKSR